MSVLSKCSLTSVPSVVPVENAQVRDWIYIGND